MGTLLTDPLSGAGRAAVTNISRITRFSVASSLERREKRS